MKRINTTNNTRITKRNENQVTTLIQRNAKLVNIFLSSFALFQLALATAACEDMERDDAYMEDDDEMAVEGVTQSLNMDYDAQSCPRSHHHCYHCRPKVTQFVLVNAETDEDIRFLEDGDIIDLQEDGANISIRAEVRGRAGKVVFSLNDDRHYHVEYHRPYYIAGNRRSDVAPWEVNPGDYTLKATPYRTRYWHGMAGNSERIEITVIDSGSGDPGGYEYKNTTFLAKHSGKALDIEGSSMNDGALAVQQESSAVDSQLWTIRELQSGFYQIINNHSGLCLSVDGDAMNTPGANLVQTACASEKTQKWDIRFKSADVYQVLNAQSNLCMDVAGGTQSNGAEIVQNDCTDSLSQQWEILGFVA